MALHFLGNKSLADLGIQQKLVAGTGISISGNVISATGGGGGGGTSNYNDLSNKPTINNVTVEGDKKARDYELQYVLAEDLEFTGENENVDTDYINVGDSIYYPFKTKVVAGGAYVVRNCYFRQYISGYGNAEIYRLNPISYAVQEIKTTNGVEAGFDLEMYQDSVVIINFLSTSEYSSVRLYESQAGIQADIKEADEKGTIALNDINTFFDKNCTVATPTIMKTDEFYIVNKNSIGNSLPSLTTYPDYTYKKINLTTNKISSRIFLKGQISNNSMWFTTKQGLYEEIIVNASEANLKYETLTPVEIDLSGADYLYLEFDMTSRKRYTTS